MELLRAARQVFATRGYHDARVDEIVAAAGVAKGTFYLYFPDKRSVFVELVDTLFEQINAAILRVDTTKDVTAQVRRNIRAILNVLLDDPQTTQILMTHAAGLDPAFAAKIRSFYQGVRTLLCESIKEGQQLGLVAAGDALLFATFTVGGLKEVLLEMTSGEHAFSRDDVAEQVFAMLQRGYLRVEQETVSPPPRSRGAVSRRP